MSVFEARILSYLLGHETASPVAPVELILTSLAKSWRSIKIDLSKVESWSKETKCRSESKSFKLPMTNRRDFLWIGKR